MAVISDKVWVEELQDLFVQSKTVERELQPIIGPKTSKLPLNKLSKEHGAVLNGDLEHIPSFASHLAKLRNDFQRQLHADIAGISADIRQAKRTISSLIRPDHGKDGPQEKAYSEAQQLLERIQSKSASVKLHARHDYSALSTAAVTLENELEEFMLSECFLEAEHAQLDAVAAHKAPASSAEIADNVIQPTLPDARTDPTTVPDVKESRDVVEAIKEAIEAIDQDVKSRGGNLGKWDASENDVFISAINAFRSSVGKSALQDAREVHVAGVGNVMVPSVCVLNDTQLEAFTLSLRIQLPFSDEEIVAHTRWHEWYLNTRLLRKALVDKWRSHVEEVKLEKRKAAEDATLQAKPPPPPKPVSPATRAAIAEWKAAKLDEKKRADELAEQQKREFEMVANAKRAHWEARQRQTLDEWRQRRIERETNEASVRHGHDNGSDSGRSDDSVGIFAPTKAELARRAAAALELAKEKRALLDARNDKEKDAIAKRHGVPGVDLPVKDKYVYVSNNPEHITAAANRRAVTAAERVEREQQRRNTSAHASAVPSVVPTARGKSFALGAIGVRPSRATPAWRKPV